MKAILHKEINAFFSSIPGYLVIAVFLLVNGLFLWILQGAFNIFNFGFANLSPFFLLAPWIFVFLIPAICMRSFSEEKKEETIELLFTKPISSTQLVLGKFLGNFLLVIFALLPTLLYVLTLYYLGDPVGNIDLGAIFGAYMGLLLLGACYTSIGLFSSSLTNNQLVAFILAAFLCFLLFFGFQGLSSIGLFGSQNYGVEYLGMEFHYKSISRGVIDTRDLIYFLSFLFLFLFLTKFILGSRKKKFKQLGIILVALLLLNMAASAFFVRFDLTKDQRYTLSPAALDIIAPVESPILVTVYLSGDLPAEFERLKLETKRILEEFSAYNTQVKYQFIDPLATGKNPRQIAGEFFKLGMIPKTLNTRKNGQTNTQIIFPWAVANYQGKSAKIHLLKKKIKSTTEETISNSIQNLEYAFANAFRKICQPKTKKIAVMRGNGELPDGQLASFLGSLKSYYHIAAFTLDSVAAQPQKTLQQLAQYDLVLEADPTQAYTEKEKYVLDQYLMQGGKMLWLIETVAIDKDSLFNKTHQTLAYPIDLHLRDLFFRYGIRINPVLVNTLQSAPIILANGQGNNTQLSPFPWIYSPLAISENNHPITHHISAVKFDFANSIDTLANTVKKTILLKSSPQSKTIGTPVLIDLNIINTQPDFDTYQQGQQNLAVLLEGKFTSGYKNRLKPFPYPQHRDHSTTTKMLVIADGNVVQNTLQRGKPVPLGFDRLTGTTYGNAEFLLNAVNYMLADNGLMKLRAKEFNLAFLSAEKVEKNRLQWQLINLLLPLLLLGGFASAYTWYRKKKYSKS